MSEYTATISWQRAGAVFTDNRYSREHTWAFDGGLEVPASASPHAVRSPFSNPANIDPEEAYVASLSSCHMLWFLSIAAKRGFLIESYTDKAVGVMEEDSEGRLAIMRVMLRPEIEFSGSALPTEEQIAEVHHLAHESCFIANSVKTRVTVEPGS